MRGLIAQTQHIHAVLQCQLEGLSPSVVTGYSTHSQVVRKDHPVESELAAQVAGQWASNRALNTCAVITAGIGSSWMSRSNGPSSTSFQISVTSVKPVWVSAFELPCPGKCLRRSRFPRRGGPR